MCFRSELAIDKWARCVQMTEFSFTLLGRARGIAVAYFHGQSVSKWHRFGLRLIQFWKELRSECTVKALEGRNYSFYR